MLNEPHNSVRGSLYHTFSFEATGKIDIEDFREFLLGIKERELVLVKDGLEGRAIYSITRSDDDAVLYVWGRRTSEARTYVATVFLKNTILRKSWRCGDQELFDIFRELIEGKRKAWRTRECARCGQILKSRGSIEVGVGTSCLLKNDWTPFTHIEFWE